MNERINEWMITIVLSKWQVQRGHKQIVQMKWGHNLNQIRSFQWIFSCLTNIQMGHRLTFHMRQSQRWHRINLSRRLFGDQSEFSRLSFSETHVNTSVHQHYDNDKSIHPWKSNFSLAIEHAINWFHWTGNFLLFFGLQRRTQKPKWDRNQNDQK